MSITKTITALPAPPSRSDPTNFDSRADTFLGALPTLATEINTWAGQANSTASTVSSDKTAAQSAKTAAEAARDVAISYGSAATAAKTAIEQALDTVAGETASVVAHAADDNPHPVPDSQFAGAVAYATDLASQAARSLSLKQNLAANLTAVSALAVTDGNFIVGNGSTFVAESGATARASLGLGDSATKNVGTTAGTVAAGDTLATETDNRVLYDEELTRAVAYATDLAGQAARTLSGSVPSNVPASASAPGVAGQIRYASGYLYVCVAANTWHRVAIATWT